MNKRTFGFAVIGVVALFFWWTGDEEPQSPYRKQNIIEPPVLQESDPAQELIDSGAIPSLNSMKSDKAKAREALLVSAPLPGEPPPMQFPTQQIKISTKRGLLPLIVGIAKSKAEQEGGMMYYRRWPASKMHGLLFIFKDPVVLTMWMKNTFIPLDIVFANAEGVIVNIHERARPLDESTIASDGPAQYVLEIPAGAAREWQIWPGDRLIYTEGNL